MKTHTDIIQKSITRNKQIYIDYKNNSYKGEPYIVGDIKGKETLLFWCNSCEKKEWIYITVEDISNIHILNVNFDGKRKINKDTFDDINDLIEASHIEVYQEYLEHINETLEIIKNNSLQFELVGSRITCNPIPLETDQDYLVLITEQQKEFYTYWLEDLGWLFYGSNPNKVEIFNNLHYFDSAVSDYSHEHNLIFTSNKKFFDKFMFATQIAKKLNLLKKDDRIKLFRAILYHEF